jgi:SWI/SNF-related matrix-associated actin-dependent regulator of chromatin subfamily A3
MQLLPLRSVAERVGYIASIGIGSYLTRVSSSCVSIHSSHANMRVAHVIRNPSTKQFKAIYALASHIRWCLTGTPVQNSLEDLGALLKFLNVPVLGDTAVFRKYIAAPALSRSRDRFDSLRTLLRTLLTPLCLRRTRKTLPQLLDPLEEECLLEFSAEEATRHYEIGNNCRQAIDMAVSGNNVMKVHQCVLQALLRLRLFCNHGFTDGIGPECPLGFPSDTEEEFSLIQMMGRAICWSCSCDITSIGCRDGASSGVITVCQHMICNECLPAYINELQRSRQLDGTQLCPICNRRENEDCFVNGGQINSKSISQSPVAHPTKLMAIAKKLEIHMHLDKRYERISYIPRLADKITHQVFSEPPLTQI